MAATGFFKANFQLQSKFIQLYSTQTLIRLLKLFQDKWTESYCKRKQSVAWVHNVLPFVG